MGELSTLSTKQIQQLVANTPTAKRAAMGKALKAASQHLKDMRKDYPKAFDLAAGMVRNWWLLGHELDKMNLKSPGRPKLNTNAREHLITVSSLGLSWSQSSRAQNLAEIPAGDLDKLIEESRNETKYNLPTVWRALKRDIDSVETPDTTADGIYGTIVIDPPWPMQKIDRDVRPNQAGFDYPTMSEGELSKLDLPCSDSCHVWVWTTHKFLPMALRLLEVWDLKYVCTFVWHKPGGFQPMGLPQYNCEFALYARKGTPKFKTTKAFPVCFNSPRGKHSEKPEEFYDVVRRVTTGKRVDMFNRRKIEGFDVWGNEA